MSKANIYNNRGLNETVIKFEIDTQNQKIIYPETFIILDIVTREKPKYSLVRYELFKNIIPNLSLDIDSKIHFIYNEGSEAKYFYGEIRNFKNISINDDSVLSGNNNNFYQISQKLRNILDSFDKEKYINMLTIVNYDSKEKTNYNNTLFDYIHQKFKYVNSQILFLNSFNYDYISFTRFSKGFSRKYLNSIICAEIYDKNKYDYDTLKNFILNKDKRAINFLKEYLEKNSRVKEYETIKKLHRDWSIEFLDEPYKIIIENVYKNDFNKDYKLLIDKFFENNKQEIEKIEQLEMDCLFLTFCIYKIHQNLLEICEVDIFRYNINCLENYYKEFKENFSIPVNINLFKDYLNNLKKIGDISLFRDFLEIKKIDKIKNYDFVSEIIKDIIKDKINFIEPYILKLIKKYYFIDEKKELQKKNFYVEEYIEFLNYIQEYINDKYLNRNYTYKKIEFWKEKIFKKLEEFYVGYNICPFKDQGKSFPRKILTYFYKNINKYKYAIFEKEERTIEIDHRTAENVEANLKHWEEELKKREMVKYDEQTESVDFLENEESKKYCKFEINRIKNNYKKDIEVSQRLLKDFISKNKEEINSFESRKKIWLDKYRNNIPKFIKEYKKAIDDYENSYQCFKDKNNAIYRNKIRKYYESWKRIEQLLGNYSTTEINNWIEHKFGLYGDKESFYDYSCERWNYSKFPYVNYAKAKLIDYLYRNLYEKRANLSQYEYKFDFGIRLDMILDIIGKIEKYYNDMIKNKDERYILMKQIKPNCIYERGYHKEYLYKNIPKFPIYHNNDNYQDFRKEVLVSKECNEIMLIKIIIVLFFIYERNQDYLSDKFNDNSNMIEKLFFIVYYLSLYCLPYSKNPKSYEIIRNKYVFIKYNHIEKKNLDSVDEIRKFFGNEEDMLEFLNIRKEGFFKKICRIEKAGISSDFSLYTIEKELCKRENLKYFCGFHSYFCYLYNIIYSRNFKIEDLKDIGYIKFTNIISENIKREIDYSIIDTNYVNCEEFINKMISKLKLNIHIDDIIKVLYDDYKIHKKKKRNK